MKACSHSLRFRILYIIENDDVCVSDLCEYLHQSQPVISQHLAVLREREIVKAKVVGNKRFYSVIDPLVKDLLSIVDIEEEM